MQKTPPIVVSGSIAIDRIMNFDGRWSDFINPDKLDVLSVSIFLKELKDDYGGVGGNMTYSLALLGDMPILLQSVGKEAKLYLEKLAGCGVNISHVFESKLPTGGANFITDGDQNQICGFYPGAMFDSDTLGLEPWKDQNPLVVVMAHCPKAMRRQTEQCREWGLRLVYVPGQQVHNIGGDDIRAGVLAAEVLIANDYEIAIITNKTGLSEQEIKSTVPIVVTTHGKKGSTIEGKNMPRAVQIGIAKPGEVADPTGAGDAFCAGFVYGYSRGWPVQTCVQLGATTAVYAVEIMGPQAHHFTFAEVAKRYEENFKEKI